MNASAIVNLLVGIAIGGWLLFGGMAGKLAQVASGDDEPGVATVKAADVAPVRPNADRPVFI